MVGFRSDGLVEDSIITDVGYKTAKQGVAIRLYVIPRQEWIETNSENIVPVPVEAGVVPPQFTHSFLEQFLNMEDPPTWLASQLSRLHILSSIGDITAKSNKRCGDNRHKDKPGHKLLLLINNPDICI